MNNEIRVSDELFGFLFGTYIEIVRKRFEILSESIEKFQDPVKNEDYLDSFIINGLDIIPIIKSISSHLNVLGFSESLPVLKLTINPSVENRFDLPYSNFTIGRSKVDYHFLAKKDPRFPEQENRWVYPHVIQLNDFSRLYGTHRGCGLIALQTKLLKVNGIYQVYIEAPICSDPRIVYKTIEEIEASLSIRQPESLICQNRVLYLGTRSHNDAIYNSVLDIASNDKYVVLGSNLADLARKEKTYTSEMVRKYSTLEGAKINKHIYQVPMPRVIKV